MRAERHMVRVEWVTVQVRCSQVSGGEAEASGDVVAYLEGEWRVIVAGGVGVGAEVDIATCLRTGSVG